MATTITIKTITPKYQYIDFPRSEFPDFFKRPVEFKAFRDYGEIEFKKCYLNDQNSIKASAYKKFFRLYLPIGSMPDGVYELDDEEKTSDNLVFSIK